MRRCAICHLIKFNVVWGSGRYGICDKCRDRVVKENPLITASEFYAMMEKLEPDWPLQD